MIDKESLFREIYVSLGMSDDFLKMQVAKKNYTVRVSTKHVIPVHVYYNDF